MHSRLKKQDILPRERTIGAYIHGCPLLWDHLPILRRSDSLYDNIDPDPDFRRSQDKFF